MRWPPGPRIILGGLPLLVLAGLAAPAGAAARPGITTLVSLGMGGAEGNGHSSFATLSGDGRYVAFHSFASNLVPGDTIFPDVFVADTTTGTVVRASVAPDGAPATGVSFYPSLSADGRRLGFTSSAANLVAGDTNGVWDVFVRDLETGAAQQASVATDGTQGDRDSSFASMSADGRYVAFHSPATNLVAGDTNASHDVFVRDLVAGTTERVSVATDGSEGNDESMFPSVSGDGRYLVFQSLATNFTTSDLNRGWDVFVHDRATGTTRRVSVPDAAAEADGGSFNAAMSLDGRYVVFDSTASNLVPDDGNGVLDVFVRDLAAGTNERVSVASDGTQGVGVSGSGRPASVSADGRYVTFRSDAANLVPGDTNGQGDAFVRDRATGTTQRASLASDGTEADARSFAPVLSADGRHIAFHSLAGNLVPADANNRDDVFVRDHGVSLGVVGRPSVVPGRDGVRVSGRATSAGTTLATADDPAGDSTPLAAAGGSDLTGASVVYRPEQRDLLVRWDLSSGAGVPGVLYGLAVSVGDERYEVRAVRAAATADPPWTAYVALYRCAPDCTEQVTLAGSFGTTGRRVLASVPLSALGATEGAVLSGIRAFAALGEAIPGAVLALDEVSLPSAPIPSSRVELGIASTATPADAVTFTATTGLLAGDFSGLVPTTGLAPGGYRVWARSCLGDACGPAVPAGVTLAGPRDTRIELTVVDRGNDATLRARLTDPGTPSDGIAGRTIEFFADGEHIGSGQTGADGVAAVAIPPGHRGAHTAYRAVFAGDDTYGASSA